MKRILFFRYYPKTLTFGFQPAMIFKQFGLYPLVGLAQIAAICKNASYDVKILDAYALHLSRREILKQVQEYNPDIVCVSMWTSSFEGEAEGIELIRSVLKDVLVIVGGPHLDLYAKETLERYDLIDYGVVGEGEVTIIELLRALESGGPLDQIKGLVFRKNGVVTYTGGRDPIKDLDTISYPLIEELPLERYYSIMSRGKGNRSMYMITARGCPFKCKYCVDYPFGRTVRFHSPEYIVTYFKYLVQELGVSEIHFYEDTFTLNKDRVLKICAKICEENLTHIPWTIRTRADMIDEELMAALQKAGCYRIGFGVESGSQEILDSMNRGMKIEDIRKSFVLSKKFKFEIVANFMIGYLGETRETYKKTVAFAKELDPDYAMFQITTAMPNSDLYHEVQAHGFFVDDFWKDYVKGKIDKIDYNLSRIPGQDYTVDDLEKMLSRAYMAFYFRPRPILRYLKRLTSFRQLLRYIRMWFTVVWYVLKSYSEYFGIWMCQLKENQRQDRS